MDLLLIAVLLTNLAFSIVVCEASTDATPPVKVWILSVSSRARHEQVELLLECEQLESLNWNSRKSISVIHGPAERSL